MRSGLMSKQSTCAFRLLIISDYQVDGPLYFGIGTWRSPPAGPAGLQDVAREQVRTITDTIG